MFRKALREYRQSGNGMAVRRLAIPVQPIAFQPLQIRQRQDPRPHRRRTRHSQRQPVPKRMFLAGGGAVPHIGVTDTNRTGRMVHRRATTQDPAEQTVEAGTNAPVQIIQARRAAVRLLAQRGTQRRIPSGQPQPRHHNHHRTESQRHVIAGRTVTLPHPPARASQPADTRIHGHPSGLDEPHRRVQQHPNARQA